MSFWVASTSTLWGPGVAVGLVVLAIAQMGVHLVFFLHITSGPDNTNNVLALAFGVLIVFLVMIGTIWIMAHMNANMAPSPEMMNLRSSAANPGDSTAIQRVSSSWRVIVQQIEDLMRSMNLCLLDSALAAAATAAQAQQLPAAASLSEMAETPLVRVNIAESLRMLPMRRA